MVKEKVEFGKNIEREKRGFWAKKIQKKMMECGEKSVEKKWEFGRKCGKKNQRKKMEKWEKGKRKKVNFGEKNH